MCMKRIPKYLTSWTKKTQDFWITYVAQETVLLVCFEKRELDVLLSTLKYVISQAEEDLLWSSEVMGLHSLKALFHTIFFLNGKHCA